MFEKLVAYYKFALRILLRTHARRTKGLTKYVGNADEICKQIVNDCWNGKYLMTSTGHFSYFWTRDFGWCAAALCRQGYSGRIKKSLKYVLKIFDRNREATTLINPDGQAVNAPGYSVDTLPWLIRSLKLCEGKSLIKKYQSFFEREIKELVVKAINKKTGLVKKGYYASIKDLAVRNSSTYDNVMIAMLKQDLNELGLKNPLREWDIKESIMKHLWNGKYFKNDLDDDMITSDANIFPFTTGVFDDALMLESCMKSIVKSKIDRPLPIRYSLSEVKQPIFAYRLIKNYQGNTVWTHMGPLFIKLMMRVDHKKALKYKQGYKRLIERYGNYLEVLNEDLTPFQSPFYMSDEGMLWAVNYLDIDSKFI